MEFLALSAILAFFSTFPGIISGLLLIGFGFALRKYTTKVWPNETALVDTIATKYGTQVADEFKKVKEKAGF
jgi:hypothetical protein